MLDNFSFPNEAANQLVRSTKLALTEVSRVVLELIAQFQEKTKGRENLVGLTLILIGSQLYYYNKFSYWSRRNVKTPRPLPFVGNLLSFFRHSYLHLSVEWPKKYGKVYGYYAGTRPYLVIADAKVLKQICIKDFDKFVNRHFIDVPSDLQKSFLLLRKDDQWKSMRAIISPTFSSGKIKTMYRIFDSSVDKLIAQLKDDTQINQAEQSFEIDIRQSVGRISMSSTIGSLFGIELKFSDSDDPNTVQNFARKSYEAFTPSKLDVLMINFVPHSILEFINYPNHRDAHLSALRFFVDKAKDIINHRKKSGERQNDYLQLLLEANINDKESQEIEELEHHSIEGTDGKRNGFKTKQAKLTDFEVISQTVVFTLVATETTAGLMANTIYLLAYHKDIQQRLYDELASIRKVDQDGRVHFNYEDISSHRYLDCVISESLRLMPPALYMDRTAGEDYFLEDYNFTIPKGTILLLDYYGIQSNSEYWPEPFKFDPERFAPENKSNIVPGSYCPFGIGPRFCIGYRYALTEGKLAVAKLVSEFEFNSLPGSKYPPEPRKPVFIGNEFLELRVSAKRRVN